MKLIVIDGPDHGRTLPLPGGEAIIVGRGRNVQIQLRDLHVSRSHCRLEVQGKHVSIIDLQSATGCYVNDVRVCNAELRAGDVIRLGRTRLRVEAGDDDDESTLILPAAARPDSVHSQDETGEMNRLIGATIADHEIERAIGEDGYGTHFDARFRDAPRTLRVLWPQFTSNPLVMDRFLKEFRSRRLPAHPNLVNEYDAGRGEGCYWVSSEAVAADSAADLLEDSGSVPLDWRQSLRLLVHLARGLTVVHRHGLLHRHLTPACVVMTRNSTAMLAGSVFYSAIHDAFAEFSLRPGNLIGEIKYMSAERTRGDKQVDARSDIYSLGVIGYQLLTARLPFESVSLPDLIVKIRTAEPIKPTRFAANIPSAVESLLMRMLARIPTRRIPDCPSLVRESEQIAQNNGIDVD